MNPSGEDGENGADLRPPASPEGVAASYRSDLADWKAQGDITGVWVMPGPYACRHCSWAGCYRLHEAPAGPPQCERRSGCDALWVPVIEGDIHPPWKETPGG